MSGEINRFDTMAEAKTFARERVDVPVADQAEALGDGAALHVYPQVLSEGTFTNVFDVSFPSKNIRPGIKIHEQVTSVFSYVSANPDVRAATCGGFFFLADQASSLPRQLGLNLSLTSGQLRSFPVVDREAVLIDGKRLSAENIQSLGVMSIGAAELTWSGSLTDHETDTKVFGNGNCIITHVHSDATGSMRVLDETSRYTPKITNDDTVDIGFIRRDDGVFIGVSNSKTGGLDIFTHDVVIRMHERHSHGGLPEIRIRTLGNNAIDGSLRGAVTVGPMLNETDFTGHPVNSDKSLGGKPPFLDVPLARTALYETGDETVHLRLYDGRPGSPIFPGITPRQAASAIAHEGNVAWGCFLDPGQTAKLVVRTSHDDVASYGNTHYLKWPSQSGESYLWVPQTGRPVASMITLR